MKRKHVFIGFSVVAVAAFALGYLVGSAAHNERYDQRIADDAIHDARNKADILNQMQKYSMTDGLHSLQNSLLLDVYTLVWVVDDSGAPQETKHKVLGVLKELTSQESSLFEGNPSKYMYILPRAAELVNEEHNKPSEGDVE